MSPDVTRMTAGGVTGTPAYMAPEIALGSEAIDGRADLYGLGCVAYWLLTGSLVFEANNPTAMALAHVQSVPVPMSQRNAQISQGLDQMITSCLSKKPEQRPANAEALARGLERCVEAGQWTGSDAEVWWSANARKINSAPTVPSPGDPLRSTASLTTM
jgi:serine/threonine-protein kinase